MRKLILLYSFLLSAFPVNAQADTLTISGTYMQMSFEELVSRLESITPLRFFYTSDMVKDIVVNTNARDENVNSFLRRVLDPYGVNFYEDHYRVILYGGEKIVEMIPDFRYRSKLSPSSGKDDESALTRVELNYLEGKKETQLEEISIGSKEVASRGKPVTISGRVFDHDTGEPLIGATIFVKELGAGAATDLDGYFQLVIKQGRYLMTISSLSMKQKTFYARVYSDGTLTIPLEKELVSINEVRIVADRNNIVTGIQMGYERISSRSIKELPAVMGEKDVLKVAQMLPGVQSAGEGSSGLIVRGGSADQNLFYINKLPIYNTSHLFGFFSAFSPDIINSFSLYKSNIPAKYGGRLSSVFDITTRQGNKKKFFGKGGISPVTAHIALEGPVIKDKSSFVLSYRGTYSDWILSRVDDINIKNSKAGFYDISGTLNTDLNENNLLKAFFYRSADQFSLSTTNDYQYSNTGGTLSWKHKFSSSLTGEFAAIVSQYEFETNEKSNPSEAYSHHHQIDHYELRADFLLLLGSRHRISYGIDVINYRLDRGEVLPYGVDSRRIPIDLGLENAMEGAIYIDDEITLFPRFTLLAGIRYSVYSLFGPAVIKNYYPGLPRTWINIESEDSYAKGEIIKSYYGPEPRMALNYILGKNNSVKLTYNRIRQYLFLLSNTLAISPTDQWKLTDYHLQPPIADQLSLGYYHTLPKQAYTASFEVYQKWIKNVVEYKDGIDFISPDPSEMLLLQGKQNVYGLEFMLRKSSGKLTGWLSYSYSRSFVQVRDDLSGDQINNGERYPANFDQPHSFNLVTNYRTSRRISLSAVVVYSSGRPITYPAAIYYSDGREILHYSARNEYRIPDYFRVDLALNYEGNLLEKKRLHSTWMLNVYNVTGRKNAYSVYFEADEGSVQGYKLSIFGRPIVTLTWNYKFGNYVSD